MMLRKIILLVIVLVSAMQHASAVLDTTKVYSFNPIQAEVQEAVYSKALLDAMTTNDYYETLGDDFPSMYVLPDVKGKRDSVAAAMNQMDQSGNYADEVPGKVDKLPIGIRKKTGNLEWTLMLTNMTVGTQGATISAYLRVTTPEGKTLMLGAEGVKLNSEGGISDMKLILIGDVDLPIGNSYRIVLKGGELNNLTGQATIPMTYATVGCQGLKLLNLVGEFELSNKLVIPVDASTKKKEVDETKRVKAPFQMAVKNWNDLIVQLTLPNFEMKGLDGVVFNVQNVVLDFSDTRNATDMKFPVGYREKYYASSSLLWRGVYIETLEVILPEQFAKRGSKIRPRFTGQGMIIDHQGVSGIYGVEANILSINEGSASGWKISVTRIKLELEANHIRKGSFGGRLQVPVSNQKDGSNEFDYTAIISDKDEYTLNVKLTDTLSFKFLMAKVSLLPNSYISLAVFNVDAGNGDGSTKKVFRPEAVLTGTLKINASNSSSGGKMGADFDFTELRLMTVAPYFRIKGVQYNGQIKFSNFPISLDRISISELNLDGQNCIGLAFNVQISLSQGKIKGGSRLMVTAYYDEPANDQEDGCWKFYKFKIYEINIGAEFSKIKVSGKIIFLEDDPLYGNAFYGSVMLDYASGKFKISSTAMFGASTFRYWYFDARLDLPVAITVVGPVMMNGFGGGAYSKMSKAPKGSELPYVPDENTSFGVKALVAYVIAKKEVCKGDIMFEMSFNQTGGVRYIAFYGNAEVLAGATAKLGGIASKLSKISDAAAKATSAADASSIASGNVQSVAKNTDMGSAVSGNIFAYVGIQYNFETSTLEANSEIYINLGTILQGRGPGGRAGWMELYVSPSKWYCYAGTPEDRLGVVFSLVGIKLQTGSYFMVGTEMPRFPDAPPEVARLLGPEVYAVKSNINETNLKSGSGFAFGLDLSLRADVNFLILYSNMNAGVGGDVMLRQYPDAHCQGSSDELGMNTWYANGRVYTYFEGELGVNVDLKFIHSKIPILYGGAAAMLEAGGPKPTWVRGYMRVVFNVLDGLVSGDMNMKFSLGDECKIVSNSGSPITFPVISDISPNADAADVDVFTFPQISFNIGIEQPFQFTDEDGTNKLIRARVEALKLICEGKELAFTKEWSNRNQVLTLVPENTLPPTKDVQVGIRLIFEVYFYNRWITYSSFGKVALEEKLIKFTTGIAPDYIPHRNVAHMYPAHDQKNVYRSESKTGYVVLKQWQDYLLEGDAKTNKYVRIMSTDGQQSELLTPTFNRSEKSIAFDISSIKNKTGYTFELYTVPIGVATTSANTNVQKVNNIEGGQYEIAQKEAQEVLKSNGEKSLLDTRFATSKYNTFADKMNVISSSISNKLVYLYSYDYVNVRTSPYEVFDSSEIFGSPYTGNVPLINYKSLLTDAYFVNSVYPKIYQSYPYTAVGAVSIKNRNVEQYGFPPAKAMYYDYDYAIDPSRMPFLDALSDVYRKDYSEIESQLMNQYVRGNFNLITIYPQYFKERFPEAPLNNIEQIEFTYQLPGNKKGSTGIINYRR